MIVVLSGTPLRLAEAASDLARSTIEADEAGTIGEVDGGVGDDSGETIRADADPDSIHSTIADAPAVCFDFAARPWRPPLALAEAPPTRPPPAPLRRYALLQCFLC